jgi:hypothetical protein
MDLPYLFQVYNIDKVGYSDLYLFLNQEVVRSVDLNAQRIWFLMNQSSAFNCFNIHVG